MTNPPAVCPACHSPRNQESPMVISFTCGTLYYRFQSELDKIEAIWHRDRDYQCVNLFDVAVQLREENERLRNHLEVCREAYDELLDVQPEELKD